MVRAGVQVRAVVRVVRPLERINHSNNRKYPFAKGKSLPFSQFRRAVVLCSTTSSRDDHFDIIYDKLGNNGYSKEELLDARERALTLDRSDKASSSQSSTPTSMYEYPLCVITFVTTL